MMNIKILIALLLVCTATFFSSCKEHEHQGSAEAKKTYTCPMHPQIIQDKPGTCPICGMDLVEFDRTNKDESLTLNKQQMALANITTMVSGDTTMLRTKQLNGRVVANPERQRVISSRIAGRIEALFIRETGVMVKKGQPLYRIYSEELATLQQEYLIAAAQKNEFPGDEQFSRIEKSARQKLILYGQSPQQIERLLISKKPSASTEYAAPESGVVAELMATEGQYVAEGGPVMRLEGYDQVWIEGDVYPAEAGLIKEGMQVRVSLPGSNKPQLMKIEFISPDYAGGSQLLKFRGALPNADNTLQPGMQAIILLNEQSTGSVQTLPAGAVIRDGKGAHIWVETSTGKFAPRTVTTGIENARTVEIKEGLNAGDKVVVTGAYLLYSEYLLKKGKDPMASHQH